MQRKYLGHVDRLVILHGRRATTLCFEGWQARAAALSATAHCTDISFFRLC